MTRKQELNYYRQLLGLAEFCLLYRIDHGNTSFNEDELLSKIKELNVPIIKSSIDIHKTK